MIRFGIVWLVLLTLTSTATAASFSVGVNFQGTTYGTELTLGSATVPPDTMGAVGPNHFVELINGAYAVYDKTGAMQSRITLTQFWNDAFANAGSAQDVNRPFDPRILYDTDSERWYAVAVDNGQSENSRLLVAVTSDVSPRTPESWHGFKIDPSASGERWADFPTMGINNDGLYISAQMISNEEQIVGPIVTFASVPKSSLAASTPSISGMKFGQRGGVFALQPAVDVENLFQIQTIFDPHPALTSIATGELNVFDYPALYFHPLVDAVPIQHTSPIPIAPRDNPPDAKQLAIAAAVADIDTGKRKFSGNVVFSGGILWAVRGIEFGGRAAVEWFKIDPKNDLVIDSGIVSNPLRDYYYPSISVNEFGHAAIGFSGSSESEYVGSYAVAGATDGNGNTSFASPILLRAGERDYEQFDNNGRNRWGDYSATTLDPENPLTFWTIQEFSRNLPNLNVPGNWATQITELDFGSSQFDVILDLSKMLSPRGQYSAYFSQNYPGDLPGSEDDASMGNMNFSSLSDIVFVGDDPRLPGDRQTATFSALFSGELTYGLDRFSVTDVPVDATMLATLVNIDGTARVFETEMLDLFVDLRGLDYLLFDAWIDLDVLTPAMGSLVINEFEPGLYHVPSMFDVLTRLHLDFDRDGFADEVLVADAYTRLTSHVVPEPGSMVLLGIGLFSLAFYGNRKLAA